MKNIGEVKLTMEMLALVLGVPAGHRIVEIVPRTADDVRCGQLSILIEGPSMPLQIEGGFPQVVNLPPR